MKADLHLHTYFSDGVDSPAEVIVRAVGLGFDVVAVTDHDTVAGVPEAMEAGRRLGVQVVPGVEITAQSHQRELHLLAYFPMGDRKDAGWRHPDFIRQLELDAQSRRERAQQIVGRLNALGVPLTMDEVFRQSRSPSSPEKAGATLGRPHVAAALFAAGHVSSLDAAFSKYLKRGCPAWVDKQRTEAREIIRLVHRVGGIVALAHPGLLRDDNIPLHLRGDGLDGIEVYHTRHNSAQAARFRSWAREHGLLVTAGSDCHGMLKGELLMGRIELKNEDLNRFLERLGSHESV